MSGLWGSYRLGGSEGYTNKDYALHNGGSISVLTESDDEFVNDIIVDTYDVMSQKEWKDSENRKRWLEKVEQRDRQWNHDQLVNETLKGIAAIGLLLLILVFIL